MSDVLTDLPDLDALRATNADVARLSRPDREARVRALVAESHAILDHAVRVHVTDAGKRHAGTVVLFSGGNDSTVLAHLFRDRATHAGHANTGIGVEATRQYVRDTCAAWGLPLIERRSPRDVDQYRAMVLDRGFPGPGHHYKMFQRLKERALRAIRNDVVTSPRRERVVFLAGRRRDESARRTNVPELEREGSTVWVSPLVNWTKVDMNTYRLLSAADGNPVPVNQVADLIHMSGECLCGAFAKEGERAEVDYWFPDAFAEVRELEALIADRDDLPEYAKRWGWGWDAEALKRSRVKGSSRVGRLCSSCEAPPSAHDTVCDPLPAN